MNKKFINLEEMEKIAFTSQFFIFIGFFVAVVLWISDIRAQQYLQARMFRLIAASWQKILNRSLLNTALISLAILVLYFVFLLFYRAVFSKVKAIPQIEKNPFVFFVIFLGYIVTFLAAGWAVNRYLLPDRFHIISILINIMMLSIILLIGRVLLKIRWQIPGFFKSFSRKAFYFVTFVAFLLNSGLFIDGKINSPRGLNIVLIVVDCLRADHMSYYGYRRETSPFVDQMAQNGIIFKNAYANAPWTKPSVTTFLTSLYPISHQVINKWDILPKGAFTLPEILRDRGYYTLLLNAGNRNISKEFQFDQGIQKFFMYDQLYGPLLTDKFISLLPKFKRKKFFAYLHYMDCHLPYNLNEFNYKFTPETALHYFLPESIEIPGWIDAYGIREQTSRNDLTQADKIYLEAIYDGQIRFVDENIKKIVEVLNTQKLLENTVVIITADHGEEFWEHGYIEHGHSLYEELLHIPLIMFGASLPHKMIDEKVMLIDLPKTILDLTRINIKEIILNLQGKSLLYLIKSKDRTQEIPLFAMGTLYGDEKFCVIKGDYKFIFNTKDKEGKIEQVGLQLKNGDELYNLSQDPLEKKNILNNDLKISELMKRLLVDFLREIKPSFAKEQREISEELKEKLKSLGYIR